MSDKGICRLTIVPVRSDPKDSSEQTTQLLFGDHYEILETSVNRNWLKIKIQSDGYVGWMDAKQHFSISEDYFEELNNQDFKITTTLISSIRYRKKKIILMRGSVLPITSTELFNPEDELQFKGEAKNLNVKHSAEEIEKTAISYLQAPYAWGGKTPFGLDCSGFTQMVFKVGGYYLKRDASMQAMQGNDVMYLSNSSKGDLAFFENHQQQITHVGILLGDGKIIHASGWVRFDQIDENGIFNADLQKYTHKLRFIKRLIKE